MPSRSDSPPSAFCALIRFMRSFAHWTDSISAVSSYFDAGHFERRFQPRCIHADHDQARSRTMEMRLGLLLVHDIERHHARHHRAARARTFAQDGYVVDAVLQTHDGAAFGRMFCDQLGHLGSAAAFHGDEHDVSGGKRPRGIARHRDLSFREDLVPAFEIGNAQTVGTDRIFEIRADEERDIAARARERAADITADHAGTRDGDFGFLVHGGIIAVASQFAILSLPGRRARRAERGPWRGRDPVIHDDYPNTLTVLMDHRVSQRHPLALLAGRCGPVMTRNENGFTPPAAQSAAVLPGTGRDKLTSSSDSSGFRA